MYVAQIVFREAWEYPLQRLPDEWAHEYYFVYTFPGHEKVERFSVLIVDDGGGVCEFYYEKTLKDLFRKVTDGAYSNRESIKRTY